MLLKLADKIKRALGDCPLSVKQRQLNILLYDSIEQLPRDDWQLVAGNDLLWSASYHRALEKSCSDNVSFRYVLIYDKNKPVAAYYIQVINLKNLSLKTVLNENYFENIYSKMNGLGDGFAFGKNKKGSNYLCICGNLFASGNYGIVTHDDELLLSMKKTFSKIMQMTEDSLEQHATVFATLLKDFDRGITQLSGVFEEAGFIPFEIDPDMILHIDKNWKTYNDYVNAISSKYRIRANSAEARASVLTIKNFTAGEIKKHASEIYDLFNAVLNNAPVRIASNTPSYFYELKNRLHEKFCFKAFLHDEKLVAFSTALINDDCLHAHHIGINYSLNKTYSLYQNILYHYVQDAIAGKVRYVNFGRDALEIKSTIGAVPKPLELYVRFSNSFTHILLESFSRLTKPRPWTQRKPFKVLSEVISGA